MASLYKKPNSPYWYLRFREAGTGKWKHLSTRFRWAVGTETREARKLEADTTLKERKGVKRSPMFKDWVPSWIASKYTNKGTRRRAFFAWANLEEFLNERGLSHPAMVGKWHCQEYLAWRTDEKRKQKPNARRVRVGQHNTAVVELKFLSQILKEAEEREYTSQNVAKNIRVKWAKGKAKEALTDDEITRLREECVKQDARLVRLGKQAWMAVSFEIALHQGVRLSETMVPMKNVDLDRNIIQFAKTKGDKAFSAVIHPGLLPLLTELKKSGAEYTCVIPPNNASQAFSRVFKRAGVAKTFHCTRVTVVTRLAIAGIDERLAKLYVNHSSSIVHAIYTKLRPEHASGITSALNYPAAP